MVPVRTFAYPLLHLMRKETPLVNARSWNFSLEKANQINKLQREKKSFRHLDKPDDPTQVSKGLIYSEEFRKEEKVVRQMKQRSKKERKKLEEEKSSTAQDGVSVSEENDAGTGRKAE